MNLSNSLSLSRFFLAILVAYFVLISQNNLAILIGLIAGITDFLDGYFARKLNQISELGKMLDPLADKFMFLIIGIAFFIKGYLPSWFIGLALSRDIILLVGSLVAKNKLKQVLPSVMVGKITFASLLLVMTGILLKIPYTDSIGIYVTSIMLILSLIIYIIRFYKEIKAI